MKIYARSQITIQMNEAFPKHLGEMDQTALDQKQKLTKPENTQTPKGLKCSESSQASVDPESHLRQTAGDQQQKLLKCKDPESHLRQTAPDQQQKLT